MANGGLMQIYQRWSPKDDRILREMCADGYPDIDIAADLNRTEQSVAARRRRKLGVNRAKRFCIVEAVKEGWGEIPPNWIVALAEASSGSGGREAAAAAIGYCAVTVTDVLARRYKSANYALVEAAVRKHIMAGEPLPPTAVKERRKKTSRAARRCLGCGHSFLSEWIGNRMCQPCLRKAEGMPA